MNNKKENFTNTVKELIPVKGTRQNIRKNLKDWCKDNSVACTNSFNMGNGYDDGSSNCNPCFTKCYNEYGPSGTNSNFMKHWCLIGCNLNNNITDTCSQVIADI